MFDLIKEKPALMKSRDKSIKELGTCIHVRLSFLLLIVLKKGRCPITAPSVPLALSSMTALRTFSILYHLSTCDTASLDPIQHYCSSQNY